MMQDFAVFLDSKTGELLNPDSTGRFSLHTHGTQTTMTLELAQTGDDGKIHRADMTLNYASFVSFEFSEIPKVEIDAIKTASIHPQSATCFRGLLKFRDEGYANTRLHFGAEDFANSFARSVKANQEVTILIVGNSVTAENINTVKKLFDAERITPPFQAWTDSKIRMVIQQGQYKVRAERPDYYSIDFISRPSFTDLNDYKVQNGMAVVNAAENEVGKQTRYELEKKVLRLVTLPGMDNEFIAFIPVPGDDQTRIDVGDLLKISFDIENQDERKKWMARIVPNLPDTPASMLTVTIKRPWDKESSEWTDKVPSNVLPYSNLQDGNAYATILDFEGTPCFISLVNSSKDKDRLLVTLEEIDLAPQGSWVGSLQPTFKKLLLANKLDEIADYDIMKHIRDNDPAYLDKLDLNHDQRQALANSQSVRGAVQMFQGGPGTGKTKVIVEVIKAHLTSNKHCQVLQFSPSNIGVDDIAQKAQDVLTGLQADGQAKNKYILRIHSRDTEKDIYMQKARYAKGKPANARPSADGKLSEEDQELLNNLEIAQAFAKQYKDANTSKFPLISDRRVQLLELSLGHVMLQYAGLIDGGPKAHQPERYEDFRSLYNRYAAAESKEHFSPEDMKSLILHANRLKSWVIKRAAVVCATVANGGEAMIQRSASESAKLIIVDEAARIAEYSLLPAMFGKYTELSGMMLFGDPAQNTPIATSSAKLEDNPMHSLLEQSFMARLAKCGLPMEFFSVQHRMDNRILSIINDRIYQGRLVSAPSTSQGAQADLVNRIEQYNRDNFRKGTNVVLIDLEENQPYGKRQGPNMAKVANGKSRYNDYVVAFAINLIYDLLIKFPDITIAYITAYKAQERLALSAKNKMVVGDTKGLDIERRFIVTTWSKCQGLEYDAVVLDWLMMRFGGMQDDSHQLNNALSRAKAGEWIISTKKDIDNLRNARWLPRFLSDLLQYRVPVPTLQRVPDCPFFKPGQVDNRTLEDLADKFAVPGADAWDTVPMHVAVGEGDWSSQVVSGAQAGGWQDDAAQVPNAWNSEQGQDATVTDSGEWNNEQDHADAANFEAVTTTKSTEESESTANQPLEPSSSYAAADSADNLGSTEPVPLTRAADLSGKLHVFSLKKEREVKQASIAEVASGSNAIEATPSVKEHSPDDADLREQFPMSPPPTKSSTPSMSRKSSEAEPEVPRPEAPSAPDADDLSNYVGEYEDSEVSDINEDSLDEEELEDRDPDAPEGSNTRDAGKVVNESHFGSSNHGSFVTDTQYSTAETANLKVRLFNQLDEHPQPGCGDLMLQFALDLKEHLQQVVKATFYGEEKALAISTLLDFDKRCAEKGKVFLDQEDVNLLQTKMYKVLREHIRSLKFREAQKEDPSYQSEVSRLEKIVERWAPQVIEQECKDLIAKVRMGPSL